MAARKTIIVTGASRGIGHATAMRFHSEGWRVLTVSRTPPPGQCPWSQERSHILLAPGLAGTMYNPNCYNASAR